ncbi:MAG: hypothetical protein AABZ06_15265, partial [Bdellovibrionota bacterium]
RETEEFNVHPNTIKSLKVGECIFSMKTEKVLRTLKIPYPPTRPKRRGGVLEREMPKPCIDGQIRRADIVLATDQMKELLDASGGDL